VRLCVAPIRGERRNAELIGNAYKGRIGAGGIEKEDRATEKTRSSLFRREGKRGGRNGEGGVFGSILRKAALFPSVGKTRHGSHENGRGMHGGERRAR